MVRKDVFSRWRTSNYSAGPYTRFGTDVQVVVDIDWRDWLSVPEFEQLRDFIPRYIESPPDRVRRARNHVDQAFHSSYIDQRCASLVTGFEGLLKISLYQATKQFALRVPKLAEFVGLMITETEAKTVWQIISL
jgi:hypothetical protein